MREFLDGAAFREMLLCAYEALEDRKQAINELNVFPVPDGDTGTNMTLTISTAADELRGLDDRRVSAVADKAASAMLRGARGNSGVILSLLFRGIAKGLKGLESCTAQELAAAMRAGVDAAYKAVMKPAEGTILTVSRVATDGAIRMADENPDIEIALACALAEGRRALEETTGQNPVLARAGVVDAGGMGYVTILDAFLASLEGRIVSGRVQTDTGAEAESEVFGEFATEEITFAYDTVYTMRKLKPEKNLDLLRAYLDSLVISEDDEMFKVHVHTDNPGDALTESAKYGVLDVAKVENMRFQHDALLAGRKPNTADGVTDDELGAETEEAEDSPAPAEKRYGFVAVCAGEGMSQLFRDLGCDRVVTGGQTMNPSTEDILKAVNRTPAETVFVLPNNKNIIMAAQQCVPLTEKQVVVVPTRTVPQGVSAMLNMDLNMDPEEMSATFMEAAGRVHTAQVTYAARDSEYDGRRIRAGEYLCLLDDALLGSSGRLAGAGKLLSKAIKKLRPEFVTIYYGADVKKEEAQKICDAAASAFPNADVTLVDGGQPVYYYLVSIE